MRLRGAAILAVLGLLPGLGAPAYGAEAVQVREEHLPNGLQILMVENHKVPAFGMQVWYRVGSRNEQAGLSGLSHLLEHMHYLGTPSRPTGAYDREVESRGGSDNAATTEDYTEYELEMAAADLDRAIALEADALANLTLPPDKVASELQVVKEERRLRTDNSPSGMMGELLGATAFVAHPYRWPVVGWMSDLDKVTREDIAQYYRTYYHPNNATLVLVGDFDPAEAMKSVRKHFGPIPKGPTPPVVRTEEPPQIGEHRMQMEKDVDSTSVQVAYKVPHGRHADIPALLVAANVLAKGKSSRLYRSLVDTSGIAQSVEVYAGEQIDPGLFSVSLQATPGHGGAELEAGVYREIERLKAEPVTLGELAKVQHQMELDYVTGQQRASSLATSLGSYAVLGDYRLFTRYLDRIRAVTPADVQRVARTYLRPTGRSVVTLVPTKEVTP